MKQILVDCCNVCPNVRCVKLEPQGRISGQCIAFLSKTPIWDIFKIPDWCPLDDAPESRNEFAEVLLSVEDGEEG